jgi:hypothetical protein
MSPDIDPAGGGAPGPGWPPPPPGDPGERPGMVTITDVLCSIDTHGDTATVEVNWSEAGPADGYVVGLCAGDDASRPILSLTVSETRALLTVPRSVGPGRYAVLVYAYNGIQPGPLSLPFTVNRLPAPQGFSIITIDGGVEVAWPAVPDAAEYMLLLNRGGLPTGAQIVPASSVRYLHDDIAGIPTWLLVWPRGRDPHTIPGPFAPVGLWGTDGWGIPSRPGTPGGPPGEGWPLPPGDPGGGDPPRQTWIGGADYANGQIQVTWAGAGPASGYYVGLCAPGETSHPIATTYIVSSPAFLPVPASLPLGPYAVVVYACNGALQGYLSEPFPVEIAPPSPQTQVLAILAGPDCLSSSSGGFVISIAWVPVAATRYVAVLYAPDGATPVAEVTVTGSSSAQATIPVPPSLPPGLYTVIVHAFFGETLVAASQPLAIRQLAAPTGVTATASGHGPMIFEASWQPVEGAGSYFLELSGFDGGTIAARPPTPSIRLELAGFEPGASRQLTVQAWGIQLPGQGSNAISSPVTVVDLD